MAVPGQRRTENPRRELIKAHDDLRPVLREASPNLTLRRP